MANAIAPNFSIPSSTNSFQCVWKLSRCKKAAGWNVLASSNGTTKDISANNANDQWGSGGSPLSDTYPTLDSSNAWILLSGPQTVRVMLSAAPTGTPLRGEVVIQNGTGATGELIGHVFDSVGTTFGWMVIVPQSAPASTTVAAGSNGNNVSNATLNVASTTGFASSGFVQVMSTAGMQVIRYTGITSTSFTGCTSNGSGTVATSNGVFGYAATFDGTNTISGTSSGASFTVLGTTVSGSQSLPTGTLTVATNGTRGFPAAGVLLVTSNSGVQYVNYTGTTSSTFTGCTGGTGTAANGAAVQAAPTYFSREFVWGKNSSETNAGAVYYICGDYAVESAMMFSTLATSANCSTSVWPGGGSGSTWLSTAVTGAVVLSTSSFTLTVTSTTGFASSGTVNVYSTTGKQVLVTYTGIGSSTTFTGCTVASAFNGLNVLHTNTASYCIQPSGSNDFQTLSPTGGPIGQAIAVRGTGGTTSNTDVWFDNLTWGSHAQIGCANAIGSAGVSPDGSFYAALSTNAGTFGGIMFTRLDHSEPGDCDPYVYIGPTASSVTVNSWNTQQNNGANNVMAGTVDSAGIFFTPSLSANDISAFGYRARGCTSVSRDHPEGFGAVSKSTSIGAIENWIASVNNSTYGSARIAAHPATTAPLYQDHIVFVNLNQIKGTARWYKLVGAGSRLDVYDSKTMFCIQANSSIRIPTMMIGPYDGSTTPSS